MNSDDMPSISLPSEPTMVPDASDGSVLGFIDKYALLRKLGGGGFGVVYLARDTVSGVEVALKTLHPLLKNSQEEMENLREKFRIVAKLTHTNIAKALELHRVERFTVYDEAVRAELRLNAGDFVMVMDYAPGVTLSKWRKQFPDGIVPLPLVIEIGRQLASALDYAHGEKIVHRDVKPANVMVETLSGEAGCLHPEGASAAHGAASGPSGRLHPGGASDASEASRRAEGADAGEAGRPGIRVRILDFGLAAEIHSSMSRVTGEGGGTSGTRPYMAPEQWLGRKQDGRTDQYALACVLYELLSGAPPFAGVFETGDPTIMMAAVKNEAPDEIEGVPPAVNAALLKALAKNPRERFGCCAEFVAGCLAQSPQSSQRESHTEPQRHGGTVLGGATSPLPAAPARPEVPPHQMPDAAVQEADVLRRKLALTRDLKAIPEAVRTDKEFSKFVSTAEDEMAVAEEAIRLDKFFAAAESLNRAETALDELRKARLAREEAERKAKAEAERKAHDEAERKKHEEEFCPAGERKVVRIGSQEVALRWCPAGSFTMGSPSTEEGRYDNESPYRVTLTRGFWIGETQVTQGLWEAVTGSNPSEFLDGRNWFGFGGTTSPARPVDSVSWEDCQKFIGKLNARYAQGGLRWALPTEAQWEYACRAGTTGVYGGTGRLDDMGWYSGNSGSKTHPVAQKQANAWGLHDMHGNVWEWCADWYGSYPSSDVTDPAGPVSGSFRVDRGGSWRNSARNCRPARRDWNFPGYRVSSLGFRVALLPVQ